MTADDPTEGIAYVNDTYMALAEATMPITDRGFLRGDATYDVAHVFNGSFFRLDDHIERFEKNMAALRLSLPYTTAQYKEILMECVRRSGLRDSFVLMTCTRGVAPRGARDPRLCANRFYAYAQPFVWIANEEQRAKGMSLRISPVRRIPPEAVDPRIKNFHWLDLTMAVFEAFDQGYDIPVLHDGQGNITEGPGFNVFAVRQGTLITPDVGFFEGMTWRTVKDICAMENIPLEVRPLTSEALLTADEVFLSSTAGGIIPVTSIEGKPVGNGNPGVMTSHIHDLYWGLHKSGWKSDPVDYRVR